MQYIKLILYILVSNVLIINFMPIYGMMSPVKKKARQLAERIRERLQLLANVVNGKEPIEYIFEKPINDFAKEMESTSSEYDPFDFSGLPRDIQQYIIYLLITTQNAQSLDVAMRAILQLIQINHAFYQLIKQSTFATQITLYLAEKFNENPYEIAKQLGNDKTMSYFQQFKTGSL